MHCIAPRGKAEIKWLNPIDSEARAVRGVAGYDGRILKEISYLTGAYLDPVRGTVKVTDVDAAAYPPVLDLFKPGEYHIYDYQFFYRNLQTNVRDRIDAYQQWNAIRPALRIAN
jgi:hypothetical protein